MLTEEKEKEIWKAYLKIQSDSDKKKQAKDKLHEIYMKYCEPTINNYCFHSLPRSSLVSKDDIRNSVAEKLWKCLDKYNPACGLTFMQFFNAKGKSALRGAIIDCLRKMQETPRAAASTRRIIASAKHQIRHVIMREPTIEEVLDHLGWHLKDILTAPSSTLCIFNQEPANSPADQVSSSRSVVTTERCSAQTAELAKKIEEVVQSMPDNRQRLIIWYYYFLGKNTQEISEFLDCAVSTVQSMKKAGEAWIRPRLRGIVETYRNHS